jgi:hypothetical protein
MHLRLPEARSPSDTSAPFLSQRDDEKKVKFRLACGGRATGVEDAPEQRARKCGLLDQRFRSASIGKP